MISNSGRALGTHTQVQLAQELDQSLNSVAKEKTGSSKAGLGNSQGAGLPTAQRHLCRCTLHCWGPHHCQRILCTLGGKSLKLGIIQGDRAVQLCSLLAK